MNIQIFGKSKCFDTKKAERYFKERGIKFQKIDLLDKGLSKGELNSVAAAVGLNALFDMESPLYKELNLDRIGGHELRAEILLDHPKLFKRQLLGMASKRHLGIAPRSGSLGYKHETPVFPKKYCHANPLQAVDITCTRSIMRLYNYISRSSPKWQTD